MIDFEAIPLEQVIARGQFSMVRNEREAYIKRLRNLCEKQASNVAAILRDAQENQDVAGHIGSARKTTGDMEDVVAEIEELTRQLELIRPLAFP